MGKAAKFPHIDDYRECIRDMDEKQAISMRYVIMEIRNHYVRAILPPPLPFVWAFITRVSNALGHHS